MAKNPTALQPSVHSNQRWFWVRIYGLSFTICSLALVGLVFSFYVETRFANQLSSITDAKYTDFKTVKRTTGKRRGIKTSTTKCQATYRFEVNEIPYYGVVELSNKPASDKTTVYFDPGNPDDSTIFKRGVVWWMWLVLVFFIGFVLLFARQFVFAIRNAVSFATFGHGE